MMLPIITNYFLIYIIYLVQIFGFAVPAILCIIGCTREKKKPICHDPASQGCEEQAEQQQNTHHTEHQAYTRYPVSQINTLQPTQKSTLRDALSPSRRVTFADEEAAGAPVARPPGTQEQTNVNQDKPHAVQAAGKNEAGMLGKRPRCDKMEANKQIRSGYAAVTPAVFVPAHQLRGKAQKESPGKTQQPPKMKLQQQIPAKSQHHPPAETKRPIPMKTQQPPQMRVLQQQPANTQLLLMAKTQQQPPVRVQKPAHEKAQQIRPPDAQRPVEAKAQRPPPAKVRPPQLPQAQQQPRPAKPQQPIAAKPQHPPQVKANQPLGPMVINVPVICLSKVNKKAASMHRPLVSCEQQLKRPTSRRQQQVLTPFRVSLRQPTPAFRSSPQPKAEVPKLEVKGSCYTFARAYVQPPAKLVACKKTKVAVKQH